MVNFELLAESLFRHPLYDDWDQVVLRPGEMLFYESARLAHGRPSVFRGQFYDNIFVHYKPRSRSWWRVGGVRWDRGESPAWRVEIQENTGDNNRRKIVKKNL